MLSNSCLVLPAVVKQQQEEISRNHVPSLFAVSVSVAAAAACRTRTPHGREGNGLELKLESTPNYISQGHCMLCASNFLASMASLRVQQNTGRCAGPRTLALPPSNPRNVQY